MFCCLLRTFLRLLALNYNFYTKIVFVNVYLTRSVSRHVIDVLIITHDVSHALPYHKFAQ